MADAITLDFIASQLERVIAGQAEMCDDIRVLTVIALRHENTLIEMKTEMHDMLTQITAMVAQHARFNDRLRRLEEQPAQ